MDLITTVGTMLHESFAISLIGLVLIVGVVFAWELYKQHVAK
jgi:hypothetical protein